MGRPQEVVQAGHKIRIENMKLKSKLTTNRVLRFFFYLNKNIK